MARPRVTPHTKPPAGDPDELSPKQLIAADALAAGITMTEAAQMAGVSRQTLSKWRHHHPGFIAALNAATREDLRHTQDQLRRLAPEAIANAQQMIDAYEPDAKFDRLLSIRDRNPDAYQRRPAAVRREVEFYELARELAKGAEDDY